MQNLFLKFLMENNMGISPFPMVPPVTFFNFASIPFAELDTIFAVVKYASPMCARIQSCMHDLIITWRLKTTD